ncbi:hypothetical protein L1787_13145 [Acuticoccus sp. M5D2P5]|uniref:DUF6950 family protein n=1 Tax=Acuticoccus kalidii TaxID=2910977 RepID=UPI001F441EBD|nr:hypothetical protein [Acuticoccus kalidii]MCF3934354.1 hypothetical protein [Acuticoccus kalidii]
MISATMKDRGEKLRAAVAALDGVPVTWGVDDCSAWPASWVAGVTGWEVLWPAYASEDEAHRLIDDAGGLDVLWSEIAGECGLRRRVKGEEPCLGDVGLIRTAFHDAMVGVVFAHGRTACWRHVAGVHRLSVRHQTIVAAWAVPL